MGFPDFSPGNVLTAADMDAVGLWLVKTQTVGTGVSSVTVSGAFSADYANYRIIFSDITTSTGNNLTFQLSGITGSVYNSGGSFTTFGSAVLTGYGPATTTIWTFAPGGTGITGAYIDVFSPFSNTRRKVAMSMGVSEGSQYSFNHYANSTTSATGFVLGVSAGSLSTGTIRVYGYRN